MASTTVILRNKTEHAVIRYSYKDYFGSEAESSPNLVDENGEENEFTHKGDDRNNSVGAVVYTIQENIKWIVAWKNEENEPDKLHVCTWIVDQDNIDWGGIKAQLINASDSTYVDSADAYGYRSSVKIEKTGATPKVNATLFISDDRISMASTTVILSNRTEYTISRYSYKDFSGREAETSPNLVNANGDKKEFSHKGDDKNSVGGVAYRIQGKIKWIVAWKNEENAPNKVITKIINLDNIDWGDIQKELQAPGSTYVDNAVAYGFRSSVEIDKNGASPNLNATLFTSK